MKKILLAVMAFSLVFSVQGLAFAENDTATVPDEQAVPVLYTNSNSGEVDAKPIPKEWQRGAVGAPAGLEKIASPSDMKMFEKIKKIGTTLFGVRKKSATKPTEAKKPETNKTTSTVAGLKKISSPSEIKMFEKIQKVGTSLFGVRKDGFKKPEEAKKLENKKNQAVMVKPEAAQCVKAAIDKKDAALISGISSHNTVVLTALATRNTCQKTALDNISAQAQREANILCVDAHQKTIKNSNESLEKIRKTTREVFNVDLKACSVLQRNSNTATSAISNTSEANGEIIINDGGEGQEQLK